MNDETIGTWLDQPASEATVSGGGAVAAMDAATSSALISMACHDAADGHVGAAASPA